MKYINENKIINNWNKMFKSVFINIDVKRTKITVGEE